MSGCRSKLKLVVCIVCLITLLCMSLWLPFQQDGGEVAQSCDNDHQPSVEEPGAKYLLYIFFIMCFYTVLYRCRKEVSVIGTIKSLLKWPASNMIYGTQWNVNTSITVSTVEYSRILLYCTVKDGVQDNLILCFTWPFLLCCKTITAWFLW